MSRSSQLALALALALCGCESGSASLGSSSGTDGTGGGGGEEEEATPPPPLEVCINEFQPANSSGPQDESGEWADWIELHNPTDSAVSLEGWTLSDDPKEPDKHVFPAGIEIQAAGFLLLWADGEVEAGSDHLSFGLDREGGSVLLRDTAEQGSLVNYGPMGADRAAARSSDCCPSFCFESVAGGTPGASNEGTALVEEVLLERGSAWRYLDTGVAPGADWAELDFDDGAWSQAPGPLGYGDDHIVSWIATGHTTTWFRADFAWNGVSTLDVLALSLLRDAGAVVYLNGFEAARTNVPDGPLSPETSASRGVSGQEESLYFPLEASPDLLVVGQNQVAVELHQAPFPDGVDLGFDLEIVGRGSLVPAR